MSATKASPRKRPAGTAKAKAAGKTGAKKPRVSTKASTRRTPSKPPRTTATSSAKQAPRKRTPRKPSTPDAVVVGEAPTSLPLPVAPILEFPEAQPTGVDVPPGAKPTDAVAVPEPGLPAPVPIASESPARLGWAQRAAIRRDARLLRRLEVAEARAARRADDREAEASRRARKSDAARTVVPRPAPIEAVDILDARPGRVAPGRREGMKLRCPACGHGNDREAVACEHCRALL